VFPRSSRPSTDSKREAGSQPPGIHCLGWGDRPGPGGGNDDGWEGELPCAVEEAAACREVEGAGSGGGTQPTSLPYRTRSCGVGMDVAPSVEMDWTPRQPRPVHPDPVLSFSPGPIGRTAKKLRLPAPTPRPERRTPGCRIGQLGAPAPTAAVVPPPDLLASLHFVCLQPTLPADRPRFRLRAGDFRNRALVAVGPPVSEH